MRLSLFTDYSLRVLMYAAARQGEQVTTKEIGTYYQISYHHLVKVVHKLSQSGYLQIRKGNGGGFQLSRPPKDINVGQVIRAVEPDFELVECFACSNEKSSCTISSFCTLKKDLRSALQAFLNTLDQVQLSDLVRDKHRFLARDPDKLTG